MPKSFKNSVSFIQDYRRKMQIPKKPRPGKVNKTLKFSKENDEPQLLTEEQFLADRLQTISNEEVRRTRSISTKIDVGVVGIASLIFMAHVADASVKIQNGQKHSSNPNIGRKKTNLPKKYIVKTKIAEKAQANKPTITLAAPTVIRNAAIDHGSQKMGGTAVLFSPIPRFESTTKPSLPTPATVATANNRSVHSSSDATNHQLRIALIKEKFKGYERLLKILGGLEKVATYPEMAGKPCDFTPEKMTAPITLTNLDSETPSVTFRFKVEEQGVVHQVTETVLFGGYSSGKNIVGGGSECSRTPHPGLYFGYVARESFREDDYQTIEKLVQSGTIINRFSAPGIEPAKISLAL